ncbi:outer membrane protein [Salmonella enterica subsp. enterica]|uniref:Outer membrane protein n=1 Tax=Salmonella enterica I TaxID=59201 RepID=A0A447TVX8_SALET|nr:outer membrane protein [Salmonella enterica subsp. enterica]
MKRFIFLPLMTYFLLMNAMAANGENNPSNLLGAPVNTAISGGSVLPEGKLLTAVNSSFRDKDSSNRGARKSGCLLPDMVIEDSLRFDRQTGIINCGFLYQ